MSVWVEIWGYFYVLKLIVVTLHVSVWVEIFGIYISLSKNSVTLHVSVWVEIISSPCKIVSEIESRSTWACELKFLLRDQNLYHTCHAPRERVSWNQLIQLQKHMDNCHAPRERVSWNRLLQRGNRKNASHAPRERVSWNLNNPSILQGHCVTLHVSVWVEIFFAMIENRIRFVTLHVSVWVEIWYYRVKTRR